MEWNLKQELDRFASVFWFPPWICNWYWDSVCIKCKHLLLVHVLVHALHELFLVMKIVGNCNHSESQSPWTFFIIFNFLVFLFYITTVWQRLRYSPLNSIEMVTTGKRQRFLHWRREGHCLLFKVSWVFRLFCSPFSLGLLWSLNLELCHQRPQYFFPKMLSLFKQQTGK